jgi:bifunctional oligoribonuclease and PAP phosphatase NrnA
MAIDWSPFVDLVRRHERFLLTTHVRPDPDGLGSMLGLAAGLTGMGKNVHMTISSNWPPRYNFMDPERCIQRYEPGLNFNDPQVIAVLDTGTWNQLGDFGGYLKSSAAAKVVIDHHLSQDELGGLRLLDTTAEATGRLIVEAIRALGAPLSKQAASDLFAALATDTGWFRHSNTTPATFVLAGELEAAGANPTYLYDQIYEQNTSARLKLIGVALARLQVIDDGKIAYTEVLRTDYAATGAIPQDTEDLVGYTRSIAGVEAGLLFMEQPAGGVKVSFRSRGRLDVARIAERFSGGGHRLASGATIASTLADAESRVFGAIREALAAL